MLCVSQFFCLSCVSSSYYYFNGNCLASCPFGYYSSLQNNSNICETCDLSCLQCIGNSLNCSQCASGLFLQSQNGNISFHCLNFCPDYYYPDVINQICTACASPCLLCYSASRCITCASGFMLQYDTCLNKCLSGYYS
jgi:proprotein convertase subtilisin/kexin type 5